MTESAGRHVCCPVCGADDAELRFSATGDGVVGHDAYRCTSPGLGRHGPIVRCRRCGATYADPQPDPDELLEAYRRVEDPLYLGQTAGRVRTFEVLLDELHALVRPPGTLLEVGCYTGVFLAAAAAAGWQAVGLELSGWAAAVARRETGLEVHECTLETAAVEPASLDAVAMWDVIEHVARPAELLGRAAELLRPGGVLGLSTHFLDSAAARLLGGRYPFLMDMHLTHFTRATLARVLADSGLEVVAFRPHRRYVSWGYLLDRIGATLPPAAPIVRVLARRGLAGRRMVAVRGLGLRNVWARRVTDPTASGSR